MTDLDALLEKALAAYDALSPQAKEQMHRNQALSFARAEAGFGSDADETAYRKAHRDGDHQTMARLEAEAEIRKLAVAAHHWKANHDEMVARNSLLRDRPDLPLERTQAYARSMKRMEKLTSTLRLAERHFVQMYDTVAPGGRYGDENRFADLDPVVIEIRKELNAGTA